MLGTSTRKVDDLMASLGGCSISRSEVSRICALLDEELAEFRERPLDEPYPYVQTGTCRGWRGASVALYPIVRLTVPTVVRASKISIGVCPAEDMR